MTAQKFDIDLFRNEKRIFSYSYIDELENPVDITSTTFAAQIKAQAGDVAVLGSADFVKTSLLGGLFTMELDGSDFASYGSLLSEVRMAYDFKIDDNVVKYGQIVLKPGVTA
jgi:hypothetical protein